MKPLTRLVIMLPFSSLDDAPAPPEVRRIAVRECRKAVLRAQASGRIETPIAEELWRAIGSEEPRR